MSERSASWSGHGRVGEAGAGAFFALVALLSAPFWLLGALSGPLAKTLPIQLPLSALMAFTPAVAAFLMVWRQEGTDGARNFLNRALAAPAVGRRRWLLIAALAMPAMMAAEYALITVIGAAPDKGRIAWEAAPLMLVLFFAAGLGEEIGWQGFAYDRLRQRWRAVDTALAIGCFWAIWHVIPMWQAGRTPEWILWQCLAMLPLRMLTAWFYARGGMNILTAAVFHAMGNTAMFLFPTLGSGYNPFITFLILCAIMLLLLAVSGPAMLVGRGLGRR